MADLTPPQEMRVAAEKLRASMTLPAIAGEIEERCIPTLNFLVSLLKAREPLADWLERVAAVAEAVASFDPDGAERACQDSLRVARAINRQVQEP